MFLLQQWITRLHFDQISSHFISIERSWSALQLFFWVQVDITTLMEFAPTAVHSSEDVRLKSSYVEVLWHVITQPHFNQISSHFTSIESSWSALQLSFCMQIYIMSRWLTNARCFCFWLASNRLADVAALQGREPSWVWQLRRWCAFPPVRCAACSCSESGRALLFLRVQIPTATQWSDDGENGRHGNGSSPKLTISPLSDACKRLICIYAN